MTSSKNAGTLNTKQDGASQDDAAQVANLLLEKYEPIAIVGIGLRLPGGNNSCNELREFLRCGGDGIVDIPTDRWDNSAFYSEQGGKGKIRTNSGGYLSDISGFDPKFFNISPKEADYIDPQQRLVLEAAWEAMEHAQVDADALQGGDGGVFVGVSSIDYSLEVERLTPAEYEGYTGTGTAHSAVAGRVSYFLGWRGPSVSIDTACSSSLVALHMATQALRRKECGIALCGGVNAIHHPRNLIVFSQANMLSPDGRCKTFDDSADGYGRSEGCAMVVLKRVSDAIRDGDRIIALVRGSSVNQDGESGGLTVPNGAAQELVMRRAISSGALRPEDIQMVEAHGTGTSLGDPIEVSAINNVFRESHDSEQPIRISSVKGNIGHTEAAAGIIGVVKAALQLESAEIFPHVGMEVPSRHIPWKEYVVDVPMEVTPWSDAVRRCLVNSFGFAGTIASVVLEQAPRGLVRKNSVQGDARQPSILTVSAKSHKALASQLKRLHDWLSTQQTVDLPSLVYASNRRTHFSHRLATPLQAGDRNKLFTWLETQQQKLAAEDKRPAHPPKLALLFTGQGAQYVGMGQELYDRVASVRETIDTCDRLFQKELGFPIKGVMFGEAADAAELIGHTQYTQPALFTLEYAVARYCISLGLRPQCVIGHSIGEIAAACIAGLFSLPDAVRLVAVRGRLMQSVKTDGGMLAVRIGDSEMATYMCRHPELDFAAVNAPDQCVISGSPADLDALQLDLVRAGVESERLDVSHAFHSRQMRVVYDRFRSELAGVRFYEPDITLISNVTGEVARFQEVADIEYWVRHIGEPVRFADGIRTLANRGQHLCLEVGPSGVLCSLGKRSAPGNVWLYALHSSKNLEESLGHSLAECYKHKLDIDWEACHQGRHYAWLDLPFYAFDRRRHWLPITQHQPLQNGGSGYGELALLGQPQPTVKGHVEYRRNLSAGQPDYLADHQVQGRVVFPGAGYVETLIAVQLALFGEHGGSIREMVIHEPLYLEPTPLEYATLCDLESDGSYSVRIVSRLVGKEEQIERLHVTAMLQAAGDDCDNGTDLRKLFEEDCSATFHADDLYPVFEAIGLYYGDAFQRVRRVSIRGDEVALAELDGHALPGEFINPALLDSAMQSMATLMPHGKAYLPVKFGAVHFFKQPRGKVRSVLQLRQREKEYLLADLMLLDGSRPVCVIRGLELKAVEIHTAARRQFYHQPVWKKRALVSQSAAPSALVMFSSAPTVPSALREAAEREGVSLHWCRDGSAAAEMLRRRRDVHHLVYHWQPRADGWQGHYSELLNLIQRLDCGDLVARNVRIWLVTELAQCLGSTDEAAASLMLDPHAASLWGFGHTLLNEYPRWRTTLVDLPDTSRQPQAWQSLLQEIAFDGGEYQVAYRSGQRHVQRLIVHDPTLPAESGDFELQVTGYGLFENIRPMPIGVVFPEATEVQVAVRAAGINFKDVLNALGMLKTHAEEQGIDYVPLPLGFEASGEIVAAGDQSGFEVGESVMLSHLGCFKSRLNLPASAVVRKPDLLSHAQAAAIPTAYITAHYALHELAKIRAGDRVLIHAAAGGVGQAALQLALQAGAEVFATASPHKWPLLRSQGVKHLMNSRSLDFSGELLAVTNGGVDIVLNSLNKDFIPASLDCLRAGGRFVELGKIGIWDQARVDAYRPGVSYYNFDLSELPPLELLEVNKRILEEVARLLTAGKIEPLPVTVYDLDDVQEAFGVLSRGANTGKLVLKISESPAKALPLQIDADHSYLVTGGFGALGQALTGKLAELGARHVALCGRHMPTAESLASLRSALPEGVRLYPLAADVADEHSVATLFKQLSKQAPALGGVFHTAGVLADAPVRDQDLPRFEKVFAPKVAGTENLLAALAGTSAFLVGFSSVASVLGSAGQGNYAAANAYIDHRLRCEAEMGRHCLSVNWGPWAEIGMAAGLNEAMIRSIEEKGILMLGPKDGLRSLFRRLAYSGSQSLIGEFDWPRYVASLPFDNPLYSLLSHGGVRQRAGIDHEALSNANPSERRDMLLNFLRASIAEVLHFESAEDVEPQARLADLGLDSLVAVELKNALESTLRVALPTSLVFDYPSVPALLDYLIEQLWPSLDVEQTAEEAVKALSDDEIERELGALMNS